MNHLPIEDQKRFAKHLSRKLPNNPYTFEAWQVSEILRVYAKSACRSRSYSVSNQQDMIDLHSDLISQFCKDNKISIIPSIVKNQAC